MKITFPHLGDAYIAVHLVSQEMGVDCIVPSLNNIDALEKGAKYSPDEICLPFKLMVGNIIEGIEKGADTVVMVSSPGPCRLGEYGELLKSILDKNGYKVEWILLDTLKDIGVRELLKRTSAIWKDRKKNNIEWLMSLKNIYKVIKGIEKLEEKTRWLCGYELKKGQMKHSLLKCKKEVYQAESIQTACKIIQKYEQKIQQIPVDMNKDPVKIVLTGEIYSLIEPFSNHYLEEKLMDMGVSFYKRISIGWWIDTTVVRPFDRQKMMKKKNTYLNHCIGGYAKDTIEEVIEAKNKNYDGVIQLLPLGCMPEIVTKAIISDMNQDLNIKTLTMVHDEMNGEAGYITRIEAFIDMLQRRKTHVLFGN